MFTKPQILSCKTHKMGDTGKLYGLFGKLKSEIDCDEEAN